MFVKCQFGVKGQPSILGLRIVVTMMPLPPFGLLHHQCRYMSHSYPSPSPMSVWLLHGHMQCYPSSVRLTKRCESSASVNPRRLQLG